MDQTRNKNDCRKELKDESLNESFLQLSLPVIISAQSNGEYVRVNAICLSNNQTVLSTLIKI